MKRIRASWIAIAFCLGCAAPLISLGAETKTYAQKLVEDTLAKHPAIVTLAVFVTPPNGSENVIIASNFGHIGNKADAQTLKVIQTEKPNANVSKSGDRFSVELPLHDVGGNTIGALAVAFPYQSGADTSKLQSQAERIRNEMSRRITYVANLVEPAQFDPLVPTNTYAQELVDQALGRHPEVLILAMHVTPPNSSNNVILASNIGRIGKKADDDDLKVIETGTPNLEVNKTGDRFEAEVTLQDVSGKTIGALSVVFRYKAGDNKAKFRQRADKIRNELKGKIPSVSKLCESTR